MPALTVRLTADEERMLIKRSRGAGMNRHAAKIALRRRSRFHESLLYLSLGFFLADQVLKAGAQQSDCSTERGH
jgi:hypothetical protein